MAEKSAGRKKTQNAALAVRNFTLPRSVTIENIQSVFMEIKEHNISNGMQFIVDASETDIVTSPAMQMLASLSLTVEAKGGRMSVASRSDAFATACATLGLAEQLHKWESNNG